jgi:hypothetical protein
MVRTIWFVYKWWLGLKLCGLLAVHIADVTQIHI